MQSIYRGDRYVIVSELSLNGARGGAPVLTLRMADGSEPAHPRCAYFGSRIVRHVARDMEDLRRGFNVLHTLSENDLAYYRDTMKAIVDASHANGLEVQMNPWGVGRTFGGEAESRFVLFRPDACQVLDDGRRVPAGCLNTPTTAPTAAIGPTPRSRPVPT